MNEVRFVHRNNSKWKEFEQLLSEGYSANPDKLSDLFISLTDDLAYSRTYYPRSETTVYLNQLAQKAHQLIYHSEPVTRNRIAEFWVTEFPLLIFSVRRELLVSATIMAVSVLIGLISNRYDPDFVRAILGDRYINMTLANIRDGDPMAVYKSMNQADMFLGLSINNIYVSFLAFVSGIFTAFGTGYIMFSNGIMLGTFHGFMAQKGLLLVSVSTIWLHGTLEIFAIIVAGAAGIVMGNSIVFPGTLPRLHSFREGALKGAKIAIGLVPVFLIAAFIEGFVSRYSGLPYLVKFTIIGLSVIAIIYYFFLYPKKLHKRIIINGKGTS